MHAGRLGTSKRLQRTLLVLQAHPDGLTTADLSNWTGSQAVHSDVAELRANGVAVDCHYVGRTAEGRRVYRYSLPRREAA